MNWDDLRIIAAVRDQQTYAAASARLRIDETTVARRVARIQQFLGVTLFNAVDGVRRPTAPCEAVLAHIDAIARHVADIGKVGKAANGVVGRIRIASTQSVGEEYLAPHAARLLAENPGLTLHFLTSDENVSFSRWEADLAIRLRKPASGDFSITKLGEVRLYLFEPAATEGGSPMHGPVVCCYPEDLDHTPESRHLAARRLLARSRCIASNLRIVRTLIEAHSAIGILPEHMCRGLLDDRRLRATPLAAHQDLWLLVQTHLKRDAATRLVIEWLRGIFGAPAAR